MRFLIALSLIFCFVFGGVSAIGTGSRHSSLSSVSPLFSAIPDYSDYTFERFEIEYGKKYHSALSRENHKRMFYENLHKINHHNAHLSSNGKTYYMKINKYADLSEEVIKRKFTGRSKAVAAKKHLLKNMVEYTAFEKNAPKSVDWRNQGAVTPVKDQGGCGSCWAHSAAESIESAFILSTKSQVILSPQHILECTPNPKKCGGTGGCEGATAELAFAWASSGVASEATLPYQGADAACPSSIAKAVKVEGWVRLPENDPEALLQAVATVGPISVSVDASAWSNYGGGIFNGCDSNNPDIDHAVQLVGYGHDSSLNQDYWLVRNSWGSGWGEAGYIRLYRGKNEGCGMDTKPQDGSACEGQTAPVKVCGTCGIWYDSSYPVNVTRF